MKKGGRLQKADNLRVLLLGAVRSGQVINGAFFDLGGLGTRLGRFNDLFQDGNSITDLGVVHEIEQIFDVLLVFLLDDIAVMLGGLFGHLGASGGLHLHFYDSFVSCHGIREC